MADKKFFTSVNNTDIIQQSEDGGGIKLTTDGKFIFGAKHQNVIDQLADENYNGTVDLNANNQSFIAVMNENSHAIEVEVPINHFSSLETPTDNVVTTNQTQPNGQNNSTGCDIIRYPVTDKITPSGAIVKGYLRSNTLSAYTSFLNHENDYKKLGWGNYGVSTSKKFWENTYPNYTDNDGKRPNYPNLKAKINDATNLTFDEAFYNIIVLVVNFNPNDDTKLQDVANNISPSKENRYVKYYDPEILQYKDPVQKNIITNSIIICFPSPLRIMMIRAIYNSGWISAVSRLLVTTRKVALKKDPQTTLGISEEESTSGGKDPLTGAKLNSLSDIKKLEKYSDQIDDILDLYNNDKANFLKALKDEFDRFYNKLVDQRKDPNSSTYQKRFKDNEAEFRKFYNEYNQIALDEALKDTDCPNESILMPRDYAPTQVQQQTPAPSPSVSPTTSPTPAPTTVEEANEDIYEANFLPMSENDINYINLGYSLDCADATSTAIDNIINGGLDETVSPSDIGSDIQLTSAELSEIDTYIVFDKTAGNVDYKNGVINPNTLLDIASICKSIGIRALITCARGGHSCETTSGNLSRHMAGTGLDIGGFLYIDNSKPIKSQKGWITAGPNSSVNVRKASAVPPDFKKICDAFVAAALTLPGSKRDAEGGAQRGVLWYFNEKSKGGNHFNHVHYSNKKYYPGWTPKSIPASFKCDCSKVKASNLKADNC